MNRILKTILIFLLSKKYIGARHTPEKKLIKSKTKWVNNRERKEFEKQYREIINKEIILRQKKRTKKCSDYHICLNPKKLKEVIMMLKWE